MQQRWTPSISGQTTGRIGINLPLPTEALTFLLIQKISGSLTATISATTYQNFTTKDCNWWNLFKWYSYIY
jgi:hypothetical protein